MSKPGNFGRGLSMMKKRKPPKFPRLECPSEKVFKDKKRKRIKKPTPEELGNMEDNQYE